MGKKINIKGERFGKLIAINETNRRYPQKRGSVVWECLCDCGKINEVTASALRSGNTTSCGCSKLEKFVKRSTTHGLTKSKTYISWYAMKARCSKNYGKHKKDYHDRSITVCERWKNSFETFLLDMGERPAGMTLDRINVNGNYEPSNCRWATAKQQANNARSNYIIKYNGLSGGTLFWSNITGISQNVLRNRLQLGWDIERLLTQKVKHRNGK